MAMLETYSTGPEERFTYRLLLRIGEAVVEIVVQAQELGWVSSDPVKVLLHRTQVAGQHHEAHLLGISCLCGQPHYQSLEYHNVCYTCPSSCQSFTAFPSLFAESNASLTCSMCS